jgi:hypothetical protein
MGRINVTFRIFAELYAPGAFGGFLGSGGGRDQVSSSLRLFGALSARLQLTVSVSRRLSVLLSGLGGGGSLGATLGTCRWELRGPVVPSHMLEPCQSLLFQDHPHLQKCSRILTHS